MQHYFQLFSLLVVFTSLITLRMILFNQKNKCIIMGFCKGGFIRSEKVEFKKVKLGETNFLFKRSYLQT